MFLGMLASGLFAAPLPAQPSAKVYQLGVLSPIFASDRHEMLELVLRNVRDRGYVERSRGIESR
jgi:hypothetical protein